MKLTSRQTLNSFLGRNFIRQPDGERWQMFTSEEISGVAGHLYLWLEEQHLHCDQNRQPGNLCKRVPTKTFTTFPEAAQLFRSVLAGFGILPLRKKAMEWYAVNNVQVVPKDKNPRNTPELRPIEKYWAIVKRNLTMTQKAIERDTVQDTLAFCGEQSGQGDCG